MPQQMSLEVAKKFLAQNFKAECRDHAFGDAEVTWCRVPFPEDDESAPDIDGEIVANGYYSGRDATVLIEATVFDGVDYVQSGFDGKDADALLECCKSAVIDRNDETGPDEFVRGQVMPGLTLEGVRKEICTPPKED